MRFLILVVMAAFSGTGVFAKDIAKAQLGAETAAGLQPLVTVAHQTFARLPKVELTRDIARQCGAGKTSNPFAIYCSSPNIIFVSADLIDQVPEGAARYLVAHLFGHAVQVRHGVADVALRAIRNDRAREAELRGMVTRQVECIAGVLVGRTGDRSGGPSDWFNTEPMADSHWGASPIRSGPVVSIGLAARDEWFRKGASSQDFAECSVGEMGAALILEAER